MSWNNTLNCPSYCSLATKPYFLSICNKRKMTSCVTCHKAVDTLHAPPSAAGGSRQHASSTLATGRVGRDGDT